MKVSFRNAETSVNLSQPTLTPLTYKYIWIWSSSWYPQILFLNLPSPFYTYHISYALSIAKKTPKNPCKPNIWWFEKPHWRLGVSEQRNVISHFISATSLSLYLIMLSSKAYNPKQNMALSALQRPLGSTHIAPVLLLAS